MYRCTVIFATIPREPACSIGNIDTGNIPMAQVLYILKLFLGSEPEAGCLALPVPCERAGISEPAGPTIRAHSESTQHSDLPDCQRAICRRFQGAGTGAVDSSNTYM